MTEDLEPHEEFCRLTGFQRDQLRALHRMGIPSGQEIKDAMENLRGDKINHGRLYPNLDVLVDKGLVDKGQRDQRTNTYTLTDYGAECMKAYGTEMKRMLEGND